MRYDWQFWIVVCCVLLAAWRMGRRVRQGLKAWGGTGTCGGGCHGCGAASAAEQTIVQLDLSPKTGEQGADAKWPSL